MPPASAAAAAATAQPSGLMRVDAPAEMEDTWVTVRAGPRRQGCCMPWAACAAWSVQTQSGQQSSVFVGAD
jgi:hypothetical protein